MKYNFKRGQKFTYAMKRTGRYMWSPGRAGLVATIRDEYSGETDDMLVGVVFEDGNGAARDSWAYAVNLVPLKEPSQKEIDAAMRLLGLVGDVTFKPHKPAFDVRTVNGLGNYSAKISNKDIVVGCTTISFEKFDEIAFAVTEARKYNEE
jgi:hypothetical protein